MSSLDTVIRIGVLTPHAALGPAFTQGLLVTHDGDDEPGDDATNFKFTRWDDVADALGLAIDTTTGDPRG